MNIWKLVPLVCKSAGRSRTRLAATLGGCLVASFIVSFFLAADHSLKSMLDQAAASRNLVVKQKDRY
jgi:hypothetical protein